MSGLAIYAARGLRSGRLRSGTAEITAVAFIRVARLQNEVGTKYFFRGTIFLSKNAPKFSPERFEPVFMGLKKIPQNPREISCKRSLPKIKKITDELLQVRREKLSPLAVAGSFVFLEK